VSASRASSTTQPAPQTRATTQGLLVVLPALNEAENIGRAVGSIREVLGAMSHYTVDVLVVNDGSRDATSDVAREAGALVVDMPYNVGIGAAVQTGFKFAHQHGYDVVLRLDGDGQHASESIPRLLERLGQDDVDVVIGSRFGSDYKTPIARRLGILILTQLLRTMTRQPISDPTSGFACFNRRAIALFAKFYPHDYPEPEAIIVMHRNDIRWCEVPVRFLEREHGISRFDNPLRSAYYMVKVILAILINMLRRPVDA
jgi:glycosyltransferase involved in cell wall biosynthesis